MEKNKNSKCQELNPSICRVVKKMHTNSQQGK